MSEIFITKIRAKDCPIVGDIEIPLSEEKRKHLIITGKNGSGKTTFLRELDRCFNDLLSNKEPVIKLKEYINSYQSLIQDRQRKIEALESLSARTDIQQAELEQYKRDVNYYKGCIQNLEEQIREMEKAQIFFSDDDYLSVINKGRLILAFFEAKRQNAPYVPNAIENINLETNKSTKTELHQKLIAYLVRLRTTYLNEKDKGERGSEESKQEAKKIQEWFEHFEKTLQSLFAREDLRLDYDDENLNYKIRYGNRDFGFNELSDGYSSLIAILAELILRMEAKGHRAYDMQGVVLIDEIETHLHIALQKEVMPFLCGFFKNIQFIITTHSPFVLSSLENAVICDLENKVILTEDVSGYSYEALTDGYFDISKYSTLVEEKYQAFKTLLKVRQERKLSNAEILQLNELEHFFETIPTYQNEELKLRIGKLLEELK